MIGVAALGLACTSGETPGGRDGGPDAGTGDTAQAPDVFGQAPAAANGVPSVVLLTPVAGASEPADAPEPAAAPVPADAPAPTVAREAPLIDQFGLVFSPTRLVVSVGDTLTFRNSESALSHNVRVRRVGAPDALLDTDMVAGEETTLVLPEAGGYDVVCDMHPGMLAFLFATDAPRAIFADDDGSFGFTGVPPGDYLIRTWTTTDALGPEVRITVDPGGTRVELPARE